MYLGMHKALKGAQAGRYRQPPTRDEYELEQRRQLRTAILRELDEKDPDDLYYSINFFKQMMKFFYTADKDLDGHVSVQELMQACSPADEKSYKNLEELFRQSELSGDNRLSLGEFLIVAFLADERKKGHPYAKKIE